MISLCHSLSSPELGHGKMREPVVLNSMKMHRLDEIYRVEGAGPC